MGSGAGEIIRNMGSVLKALADVAIASTKSQRPYHEANIARYDALIAHKEAEIVEYSKYPTGGTYVRVCKENIAALKKLRAEEVKKLRLER